MNCKSAGEPGLQPSAGAGALAAERAGDFFEDALAAFRAARRRRPSDRRALGIGRRPVTVEISSSELADLLLPTFAHLAAPVCENPDLTIFAWEGGLEGAPPAPPWNSTDYYGNGEIRGFGAGVVRAAFDVQAGILSLYHVRRRLALCWARNVGEVPAHFAAAPFRTILQWHAESGGRQLAHAAAVGAADGGALIVGAGGAGKSSAAVASFLAGLSYAGDDYVLVEPDPAPWVHSLYGTAKLDRDHLKRRFPELEELAAARDRRDGEKALLDLVRFAPAGMSSGFPLRAILLPRLNGRAGSRVVAASGPEALRALLPHTLFPLPGARREAFSRLATLVRRLPCFVLEAGSDRAGLVGAVREVLGAEPR